jgi:Arc/MetJ-type ribon-helix-helix transcriptional regulator
LAADRITVRLTAQDVRAIEMIRDHLWARSEFVDQSQCVRHALRYTAMTLRKPRDDTTETPN